MSENTLPLSDAIKSGFAGIGAYFAGLHWGLLIVWFSILVIDTVVGTCSSLKNKKYKSNTNRVGLMGKIVEVFFVISLALGTYALNEVTGLTIPIIHFFLGAFIVKDLFSILETARDNGVKIPQIVEHWLADAEENINSTDNLNKGE